MNQVIKTEVSVQIYEKLKQLKRDIDSGEVSAGLKERIASSEGVDAQRMCYLEHMLLWVFCCESWFGQLFPLQQPEGVECSEILISFNKALKLAVLLPDTEIAVRLFEHQGVVNLALKNYPGAIKSFQRMRDVSEELENHEWEIRAYMHLGETLQHMGEYRQALVVLKRMLQVAWFTNNLHYELFAYELIGKQHYYLNDLRKASYYLDRTLRGKFELKLSKVREFSDMHYKLKLQHRAERGQLGQGAIHSENAAHNDRVQNCID